MNLFSHKPARFGKKALILFSLCLAVPVFGQGQGTGSTNGNTTPPGQVKKQSVENRLQVIGRDKEKTGGTAKPDKPNRPDNPALGQDVQALVKTFNADREKYLEQQKELNRLKEDSKEAREALREQTKEYLNLLKEQQKQMIQEAKERSKELKKELHPDMGRVIDAGVGEGRER